MFHLILEKAVKEADQHHSSLSLEEAKNIAIIFEDPDEKLLKLIKKLVDQFTNNGKKVDLLCYFSNNKIDQQPDFPFLTKKDLNWAGIPKVPHVLDFIRKKFDLLICLQNSGQTAMEYISSLSGARFRVGPMCDNPFCFDLMVDYKKERGWEGMVEQMLFLLTKMRAHHEPQTA